MRLINYYLSIGIEKFIIGDNNAPNTEKISDGVQDYINKGMVEIKDLIGKKIKQG